MWNTTLVIDLDNTLVDTSCRKYQLLIENKMIDPQDGIEIVKKDYHLEGLLGDVGSEKSISFLSKLNSPQGILNNEAPLFSETEAFLKTFKDKGLNFIILSARTEDLRVATREELDNLGVGKYFKRLILKPEGDVKSDFEYKRDELASLMKTFNVVASIGDRPEDIQATLENSIPAIHLSTTCSNDDACPSESAHNVYNCANWEEVTTAVNDVLMGIEKMSQLREEITRTYSGWLGDIDNKCSITVIIATAIAALNGAVINGKTISPFGLSMSTYFHAAALCLAAISMMLAVYSFAPRHITGKSGTTMIGTLKEIIKKLFLVLRGKRDVFDDPINHYKKIRGESEIVKSRAHIEYFYKHYESCKLDSLVNMRLFEVRATMYEKIKFETYAVRILQLSIFITLIAVVYRLFVGHFG